MRMFFFWTSIVAMILPLILIWQAMEAVNWDFSIAQKDLSEFASSVFGRVVLSGYFLSGLSLTVFIVYEAMARANNYLFWALLVVITFGIGAALPFYLYLRLPREE